MQGLAGQPVPVQPVSTESVPTQPLGNQPLGNQPVPVQPLGMGDPGLMQPMNMGQPMGMAPGMQPMMGPAGYPAPAYGKRKRSNGNALKLTLIWSGVGVGVVTLVVLLVVLRPWEMFGSGPSRAFYGFRDAMVSGQYWKIYNYLPKNQRQRIDQTIDQVARVDFTGEFSELKNLSGAARFKAFLEKAENSPLGKRMAQPTESQKNKMRNTTVKKIEYNDDGTRATLTLNVPDQERDENIVMIKEDDGWKCNFLGRVPF